MHDPDDLVSNPSNNPSVAELLAINLPRRRLVQSGLGAAVIAFLGLPPGSVRRRAPDQRTMFVDIQHPGETPGERSDPPNPKAISSWPDGPKGGRPHSATLAIRRVDGGPIGT